MLIILITGLPASGKTTLGQKIAQKFSLPFLSKDEIKEQLFDTLGSGDREWSRKLSEASNNVLMILLAEMIRAKKSCIVESNFPAEKYEAKFNHLKKCASFQLLQIVCDADRSVLQKRLEDRASTGSRHPGHLDKILLREFTKKSTVSYHRAMKIIGRTMIVNTTRFEDIDYHYIFMEIENILQSETEN